MTRAHREGFRFLILMIQIGKKKTRNEGFFALLTSYDRNTPCVGAGGGTSEPKLTSKHGKRLQCHRHQVICSDKNDVPD